MSGRKSKIIGWLTLVTMLFACSEEGNIKVGKPLSDGLSVVKNKESKAEVDTSLYKLYKAIMDTEISDEINFDIIRKNFFSVALPSKSAYCFYFRFIQVNKDASLSEEVSINSFKMWKENKEKCGNLLKYVSGLPIDIRSNVLKALVQAICVDLNANDYNLQLFKKDFPFLRDSVSLSSAKSCFDNWVE